MDSVIVPSLFDLLANFVMTVKSLSRLISHVILDLDGTLLNTDGIVEEVMRVFLVKYGKQWDRRSVQRIVGKTPLEAANAIVEDYSLPCSTEEFMTAVTPLFTEQWCNIKTLSGANRLIRHLSSSLVPLALASNSPRSNIESKISYHHGIFPFTTLKMYYVLFSSKNSVDDLCRDWLTKACIIYFFVHAGWKGSFSVIVGGDEVKNGKPSPEIFLEAAKRMNADPSNCLVVEDSLPGVEAGKAAGMKVVAVPSIPKQTMQYSSADEVINSLLDLQPEKWGLPPFNDCTALKSLDTH
ncbi:hypothetical protein Taro_017903 [Colocasia esculenta]|uniref:Uncharacterized protein n=1 Tax=Colocasia esculenta TaxID=4460 RepID=A0A843UUP8_COLES|nr:hypothetical protein [Colocasia esculenta]